MLTRQYFPEEQPFSPKKTTEKVDENENKGVNQSAGKNVTDQAFDEEDLQQPPSLAAAVQESVQGYIDTMGGEPLTELYEMVLSEIEAPLLDCVLKHTDNNQSRTAAILGLNRGTLRKKLKKYRML